MTPWTATASTTPLSFVLIPSGKHAAFRDWDAPTLALHSSSSGGCARCNPSGYPTFSAKHRADVAA